MSSASGNDVPKKIFDYDVIERLGEGARSTIYAVSHRQTRQIYALKHVKRKTEKDERFIEQLMNEYEVARKVNHPFLRKMVDLKTARNLLLKITEAALVMELFDGAPLEHSLPRSLGTLTQVFIDTAKALAAMHNHGLVHCDLKPNNIMREAGSGKVKVIDFGQACPIGTEKPRVQGTPDFIAPEQVRLKPVSVRTDVYNFGATLYWALTGQRVPTLYTIEKVDRHILKEQHYPAPIAVNPQVPERLSRMVMECLRYRPAERPGDMQEVLDVLEITRDSPR